ARSWSTCAGCMPRARTSAESSHDADRAGDCSGWCAGRAVPCRPGIGGAIAVAWWLPAGNLHHQPARMPGDRYTIWPVAEPPGAVSVVATGADDRLPGRLHHLFHLLSGRLASAGEWPEPVGSGICPAQCVSLFDRHLGRPDADSIVARLPPATIR